MLLESKQIPKNSIQFEGFTTDFLSFNKNPKDVNKYLAFSTS